MTSKNKNSERAPIDYEAQQDVRKIAFALGVPAAFAVALLFTDLMLDKLERTALVRRTREKAELIADRPCQVEGFTDRKRLELPSRRRIAYICGGDFVTCGPDSERNEYECKNESTPLVVLKPEAPGRKK